MGRMIDLTGKRFGKLIVVKPTDKRTSNGGVVWLTKCDCGELHHVSKEHLENGATSSCGCLRREVMCSMIGSLHHKWNPALTNEERTLMRRFPEYLKWRKSVYKRDNYSCQKCGKVGGRINAHHIEGYADNKELRTELSNGITLCEDCHKDFHRTYGNHSTREQFEEWL